MRHFSLALVIALLFSHFVIALPGRSRKGGAPQHKPSLKPSAKSQVIGKTHPPVGRTSAYVPKTHSQVQVGDIVGVKVKEHDPNEKDPRVREMSHGAVVLHKEGQTLHLAPITTHPRGNRKNYAQAKQYVQGVKNSSHIHIGSPHQVHENNVDPNDFRGFKVHNFQGLKNRVEAKNGPIGTPSGSSHQQHGGAAGTQAKASPPNNGAFRQRTSAPPNQPKHSGKNGIGHS